MRVVHALDQAVPVRDFPGDFGRPQDEPQLCSHLVEVPSISGCGGPLGQVDLALELRVHPLHVCGKLERGRDIDGAESFEDSARDLDASPHRSCRRLARLWPAQGLNPGSAVVADLVGSLDERALNRALAAACSKCGNQQHG